MLSLKNEKAGVRHAGMSTKKKKGKEREQKKKDGRGGGGGGERERGREEFYVKYPVFPSRNFLRYPI
jgi:hypothetical protein